MNKIKKSAFIYAAGATLMCTILFVACNKENSDVANLNNLSGFSKSEMINPNNSGNKLDSIGINHNIHLDDVLSIINQNYIYPNNLSSDDALGIYQDYLLNKGYSIEEIDYAFQIIKDGYSLPTNVEEYINSLQDSISVIPNESYGNYKDLVIRYENRIMADTSLSDIEEGSLLAFTSVLRHSMYFWYESPSKALPNWLKIAGADATGAAVGMAGGASLGWTGSIIIGVIGAVGKSLEKAEELEKLEKPTTDTIPSSTDPS